MSMQTDVKSGVAAAGTSTTIVGPARVKGLVITYPVAGGTVTIKDVVSTFTSGISKMKPGLVIESTVYLIVTGIPCVIYFFVYRPSPPFLTLLFATYKVFFESILIMSKADDSMFLCCYRLMIIR